jgi:hypothetical protein
LIFSEVQGNSISLKLNPESQKPLPLASSIFFCGESGDKRKANGTSTKDFFGKHGPKSPDFEEKKCEITRLSVSYISLELLPPYKR